VAQDATATLYVKTVAQGVDAAARQLGEMARATARAGAEYKTLDTSLRKDPFAPLTQSLAQVGRVGQQTFGMLAGSAGGFLTAGMQGTAEAIQLRRALADISLQAASVFTPWIHKAIDLLQRLAQSLRNVTGETQRQIRAWVAGAASLSRFMALLGGRGLPGVGAIPLVGGAMASPAGAMLAMAAASEQGRAALVELAKATGPLVAAFTPLAIAVASLATAIAKAIAWILSHLPGGKGREASAGEQAGAIAAAGGVGAVAGVAAFYKMGLLSAGGTVAGAALTGTLLAAPLAGFYKGVSDARADMVQNRTDVANLKKEAAQMRAELRTGGGAATFKFQREAIGREIARREARIKELEGGGAAKEALTPFTPGFEAVTDLYRRIAEAASAETMKSDAAQTAENTARIRELLETMPPQMAELARRLFPDIDRPGDS